MEFLASLALGAIARKPGTGVFVGLDGRPGADAFLRFLTRHASIPERVVFVETCVEYVPTVPVNQQGRLAAFGNGIFHATLHYGFNDDPDLPRTLQAIADLHFDPSMTLYYVGRDGPSRASLAGMPTWKRGLLAILSKACVTPAEYFCLPKDRVVTIGEDGPVYRYRVRSEDGAAAHSRR